MEANNIVTYSEIVISILNLLKILPDYVNKRSKQDEYVKFIVKKALSGCYLDWGKPNKFAIEESNVKLKQYTNLLNTVNAELSASNMLSSKSSNCILELSREMTAIASEPIVSGMLNSYTEKTDKLFSKLNYMYENFDNYYERYKKES